MVFIEKGYTLCVYVKYRAFRLRLLCVCFTILFKLDWKKEVTIWSDY